MFGQKVKYMLYNTVKDVDDIDFDKQMELYFQAADLQDKDTSFIDDAMAQATHGNANQEKKGTTLQIQRRTRRDSRDSDG